MLRAKIDMASPNMHMRDPVIYRIKHAPHHRTGDDWAIKTGGDLSMTPDKLGADGFTRLADLIEDVRCHFDVGSLFR